MDIYTYLKKDHKKVSSLFEETVNTAKSEARLQLFSEIKKELTLHADSEQATFYKALNKTQESKDEAKHAKDEHKDIKNKLEEISAIASVNDTWLIKFGELKLIVEHHVEEEETEIFKIAKKMISKTTEISLVEEMELEKQKILAKMEKE